MLLQPKPQYSHNMISQVFLPYDVDVGAGAGAGVGGDDGGDDDGQDLLPLQIALHLQCFLSLPA